MLRLTSPSEGFKGYAPTRYREVVLTRPKRFH